LQGVAGTGKTLLALASALQQSNKFQQIILARPIVPLSNNEIGFLPGDANDKIGPYMEPLWDNLKFIKSQFGENEKKRKAIEELEENGKIVITPLAFIRGRSLSNIMFIVDEAQNLTPHEIKTIITRAGENTKIVFTGDVNQIDTPYLDENSNGLAYLIDRLKGQPLFAHVKLEKGERSELANLANDLL
ncbi:MAG: PhoH family protein, partial [Crocinitomicaceae bacterium]